MSLFTAELITGFLGWLESERACSITTRNLRLTTIHSFLRYVQYEEPAGLFHLQKAMAVPMKKAPKAMVEHLSPEAMQLLLAQPDRNSLKGRRDLILLSVLYDTGARVQELIDLRVGDVFLDTPAVIQLTGKGNKTRRVPLMKNTVILLQRFKFEQKLDHPSKNEHSLFTNNQRNKLTKEGVAHILTKYAEAARKTSTIVPPKVRPHMLRQYGERYKMVSGDSKPAKPAGYSSIHSPFYHYRPSEIRKAIKFLSSDQSGSSFVGKISTYAASSAFRRVSVSALA